MTTLRRVVLLLAGVAGIVSAQPVFDSHNARFIWSRRICTTAPTDTQVLSWSAAMNCWNAATASAASISFPQTVAGTTTSGGIVYFSSATQLSSSGLLGPGNFILGGGAGGAPTDAGFAPSALPYLNPAGGSNTYTAGIANIFPSSNTSAGLRLPGHAYPSAPVAGDIGTDASGNLYWYNGTAHSNITTVCGADCAWTMPGTSQTIPGMNQANTAGASFTLDVHSATSAAALIAPTIAGASSTTNGAHSYDTTNKNWHFGANSVDNIVAIFPSGTIPTNGHCAQWAVSSNVVTLLDSGSACGGASGAPATVTLLSKTSNYTSGSGDFSGASTPPTVVRYTISSSTPVTHTLPGTAPALVSSNSPCETIENSKASAPWPLLLSTNSLTLDSQTYTTQAITPGNAITVCSDGTDYFLAHGSLQNYVTGYSVPNGGLVAQTIGSTNIRLGEVFVPTDVVSTQASFNISTADGSNNSDIGVYAGSYGGTCTQIADIGAQHLGSTGNQSVNWTQSKVVIPKTSATTHVFLAATSAAGTLATYLTNANTASTNVISGTASSGGALPSSLTCPSLNVSVGGFAWAFQLN